MDPVVLITCDVSLMVESLAATGLSTVDLLCAVRLHVGCSLREARDLLTHLSPAIVDFDPGAT